MGVHQKLRALLLTSASRLMEVTFFRAQLEFGVHPWAERADIRDDYHSLLRPCQSLHLRRCWQRLVKRRRALLRNRLHGHEFEAQLAGLHSEPRGPSVLESNLLLDKDTFVVGLARCQQMVHNAR